jgi:hypothetical protein
VSKLPHLLFFSRFVENRFFLYQRIVPHQQVSRPTARLNARVQQQQKILLSLSVSPLAPFSLVLLPFASGEQGVKLRCLLPDDAAATKVESPLDRHPVRQKNPNLVDYVMYIFVRCRIIRANITVFCKRVCDNVSLEKNTLLLLTQETDCCRNRR